MSATATIAPATTPDAASLFEQAKQLPAKEQEILLHLLQGWQEKTELPASPPEVLAKKFVIPDYAARLKEIFGDRIVIEDPQAFWDELRSSSIDYLR